LLKLQSAFWQSQTLAVSECCLTKLFRYILFEKYINISALEIASPWIEHCASCIGALSFRKVCSLAGDELKTAVNVEAVYEDSHDAGLGTPVTMMMMTMRMRMMMVVGGEGACADAGDPTVTKRAVITSCYSDR